VPPLSVAALGWIMVVLGVEPSGSTWDVTIDATGWALVALGWQRLVRAEASFALARTVALLACLVALARLPSAPDGVDTFVDVLSLMLVALTLAVGAGALLVCSRAGGSATVAGQASFLRWGAIGLLVVEVGAAVGYLVEPGLGDLVVAAGTFNLAFAAWFTLLQLFSAGRRWAKPAAAPRTPPPE